MTIIIRKFFLHECFYEYEYELENGSYAIA